MMLCAQVAGEEKYFAGDRYFVYVGMFSGILATIVISILVIAFYPERRKEQPKAQQKKEETAAERPPIRRKMRCKQCNGAFGIKDTGMRPLLLKCPHCGKKGGIK